MGNPSRAIYPLAMFAVLTAGCGNKADEQAAAARAAQNQAQTQATDIVCSYAPSQSAVVAYVSAAAGGSAAAAVAIAKAAGLTALMHCSGAYILSGAGGYVAGTLGSAIVGPVLVGAGVVVGGSVATLELLYVPKNHPEFTARVDAAAMEFASRSKADIVNVSNRTAESVGP